MSRVTSALVLTVIEARVLGCLFEKQRTVADQYPLTLKALVAACNQTTSREPVMQLSDHEVESAITSLKTNGLARLVHPSHGRSATRYRQVADEAWQLEADATSLVTVLLLRGPQTVAELRTRTERIHSFSSLDDVESVLDALATRGIVRLLPRRPGQKEPRWQQLLAHESDLVDESDERDVTVEPEDVTVGGVADRVAAPRSLADRAEVDRTNELAARVVELEARVARLEAALSDLL